MQVTLVQSGRKKRIHFEKGDSLLKIIRENGYQVPSPCGGNGNCGKCRVHIENEGWVTACSFYPDSNTTAILPDQDETKVFTAQYKYSLNPDPDPGDLPPEIINPVGIAIDIGTTTLAFYFYNLKDGVNLAIVGVENPQTTYGADVISRILHSSKPSGLTQLQNKVVSAINKVISQTSVKHHLDPEHIVKIAVAGNTTMMHLFAGVDPSSIAVAPFKPVFTGWKTLSPDEIGLTMNPAGRINLLPSLSGYIGADIVAGMASLDVPETIQNYLFIDIGTNGEIALAQGENIFACSTAAGPAFEGATIACGMGAFQGAISKFDNPENYHTIGGKEAVGICGSGLIDIVAWMVESQMITKDGQLDSTFYLQKEVSGITEVFLNQQDIREVQLAKAAISAGIKTLLKIANLTFDDIGALFLAGGFGNYLNIHSAVTIGLLPAELETRIVPIGNTSGTGASLFLKTDSFKSRIDYIKEKSRYIELSGNDDFVVEYAMNMNFP